MCRVYVGKYNTPADIAILLEVKNWSVPWSNSKMTGVQEKGRYQEEKCENPELGKGRVKEHLIG